MQGQQVELLHVQGLGGFYTPDVPLPMHASLELITAPAASGEAMYDQRLFNQDTGTAAGFGAEDTYNTYDKPLFADRGAVARHRPTGAGEDEEEDAERSFKPDKVRGLCVSIASGSRVQGGSLRALSGCRRAGPGRRAHILEGCHVPST